MIKINPYSCHYTTSTKPLCIKRHDTSFCSGINKVNKSLKTKKALFSLAGLVLLILVGVINPKGPVPTSTASDKPTLVPRHRPIDISKFYNGIKFKT